MILLFLIFFLILFVSISFLVNIGKEMSLPGFRKDPIIYCLVFCIYFSAQLGARKKKSGRISTDYFP